MDHTDPDVLEELYWDQGMTLREVAEACEVTNSAIRYQMNKHGIETRGSSEHSGGGRKVPADELSDKEWLRKKYVEEGLGQVEIGEILGVAQSTVGRYMRKHGIDSRSPGRVVVHEGDLSEDELQAKLIDMLECKGYDIETEKLFGDWRCDVYAQETDTAFEVKGWGAVKPDVQKAIGQASCYYAHGAKNAIVVIPGSALRESHIEVFDSLEINLLVQKDDSFKLIA